MSDLTSAELKTFSRRALMKFVPKGFRFKTYPWLCQLTSFILGCSNERYNFWLDLGLGKSKVSIDIVRFIAKYYRPNVKVLVCCLNDAAMGNWAEQVSIHGIRMKTVLLEGPLEEKLDAYEQIDSGFYILHYSGFRTLYSDLKIDNRKGKEGKQRRVINKKRVIHYGRWDVVILDEAHLIKNKKSLVFRIILRLSRYKKLVGLHLLTGTPFGKSLLDLWSPYFIVDGGETFGSSLSNYKEAYFKNIGFWGQKWVPTEKGEARIKEKMFRKAIRYEESEAKDLPKKVYITEKFHLTPEQQECYERLIDKLPVRIEGKAFEAKNKSIAFRQVVSGFLMRKADGGKTRKVRYFQNNPKMEELLIPLIESTVDKSKIVIFHDFVIEGRMIESVLKKMKIQFASLRGEISDKYEQYTRYRTKDEVRVLVAHPKSGGSSLDLVVGNYCIFYSLTRSFIDTKQCEKRVHRHGQKSDRVFFYYLIGKDTIEETILKDLQMQKDRFAKIVDNRSFIKLLRGV